MHQNDGLPHDHSDREALVRRAVDGDEDAFRVLYDHHAVRTWRLAYALTGTTSDAVGVVSESFARTFTGLRAGVGGVQEFPVVLLETTRQQAIDARRAHGESLPPFEAPDDALVLATAFAGLPERWRAALWLDEVEDLGAEAIGSVIDLDPAATIAITDRARSGLREQYLHADVDRSADRNCGRAVTRLTRHVEGTLPASDSEKLERHLGLCPSCTERCTTLRDLGAGLGRLVPPLPAMLEDDARIAWSGAVVTSSGPGLSALAQKALAGVAAVAAGVGVIGAALASMSGSGDDGQAVAPIAPIVTELAAPRPPGFDIPVGVDLDPGDISGGGGGTADDEFDGATGARARSASATPARADLATDDVPSPPTTAPPATDVDRTTPTAPPSPSPTSPTGPDTPPSEPMLQVGTDAGGVPIAVDLGQEPGVTLGPISVGSEPQPGQGTISVGGPLEPLTPVVGIVDDGLSGLLGG